MAAAATTAAGGGGDVGVTGQAAVPPPSAGSGAASALALLLREDPLLLQHGLTSYRGLDGDDDDDGPSSGSTEGEGEASSGGQHATDDAAHSYAAALLHDDSLIANSSTGLLGGTGSIQYRQRAAEALAEVDRKLALVESLSQRISRDAPEEVAGPLLRLHGFELLDEEGNVMNGGGGGEESGGVVTLATTRDKAERIQRQSQVSPFNGRKRGGVKSQEGGQTLRRRLAWRKIKTRKRKEYTLHGSFHPKTWDLNCQGKTSKLLGKAVSICLNIKTRKGKRDASTLQWLTQCLLDGDLATDVLRGNPTSSNLSATRIVPKRLPAAVRLPGER